MDKKKIRIIIIASVCALFLSAAVYTFIALTHVSKSAHTAVIKQDGRIIRTVDLNTAQDETFTVAYGSDYNIITIENGKISVKEASCPDKVCIKHGELKNEFLPIICLPNRLEIILE